MEAPSLARPRITSKSRSTPAWGRYAVGSSIATSARSVTERSPTGRSGDTVRPTRASAVATVARSSFHRIRPPIPVSNRLIRRFSRIVIDGTSARSWWMKAMPVRTALSPSWPLMSLPHIRTVMPGSAWWKPDRILIRVDLPDPFWPIRAQISPARRSKEAGSRTRMPVKVLAAPVTLRVSVMAHLGGRYVGDVVLSGPAVRGEPTGPDRSVGGLLAPELGELAGVVGVVAVPGQL